MATKKTTKNRRTKAEIEIDELKETVMTRLKVEIKEAEQRKAAAYEECEYSDVTSYEGYISGLETAMDIVECHLDSYSGILARKAAEKRAKQNK